MDYERLFLEEVKQKKKGFSGVRGRTGKLGFTGKILTPVDFMTRKQKYNYRKGGKIMTYNLFDSIMKREEFDRLNPEKQKDALESWRDKYKMNEIIEGLNISHSNLYKLMDELGVKKKITTKKKKTAPINNNVTVVNQTAPQEAQKTQQAIVQDPANDNPILKNELLQGLLKEHDVQGLNLSYTSRLTAEEIQQKLEKLSLSIDGEKSKFILDIKILET